MEQAMSNADDLLISSIREMRIPEHALYALLGDYADFLESLPNGKDVRAKFEQRCEDDKPFSASVLREIEASMLAATLMMSLGDDVDFESISRDAFPKPADPDLWALRREMVSRAISMSKDVPQLAALSLSLVRKRQDAFCSG